MTSLLYLNDATLVLEDFREKFLRCGPRPHIGSVVGRSARCGEAVISAAVEFQLPIDRGLAQFLDHEIHLRERGGRIFSAVQDEDAALDVLRSPRREVAVRAVDGNRPDHRRAGMRELEHQLKTQTVDYKQADTAAGPICMM